MSLSDREKFIVHYMVVQILAVMENRPLEAADSIIESIKNARVRKLSSGDAVDIINSLQDEMIGTTGFLIDHRKRSQERKNLEDWI